MKYLHIIIYSVVTFPIFAATFPHHKALSTAEFKSHMLVYFPLPKSRKIILRITEGAYKNCDVQGVLSDSINYMVLYSGLKGKDIESNVINVSYDLNVTGLFCAGHFSPISGYGNVRFKAVPNPDRSPRYQTIKRKHKVVILFDSESSFLSDSQ